MLPIALCFVGLLVIWTANYVRKWRNPVPDAKLPPGSMGLPLIGETIQFFRKQSTFDIHPFVKYRMKRYGAVFKTSLVGRPVIVSADPEFSHSIFLEEGKSVQVSYMESFMELVGMQSLSFNDSLHVSKFLKTMIVDLVSPEKQKAKALLEIDDMARHHIAIWANKESVELNEVSSTMSFGISSMKLLSYDPSKYTENMKDYLTSLMNTLVSFPLNIPGTVFHKCLKDQKKALRILKEMVKERCDSNIKHGDLIDIVIEATKIDKPLFDMEAVPYFVYAVLFASFEPISLVLCLAIKFISENPAVGKALIDEHEGIIKKRKNVDSPLTWEEYKSMTFTAHIIDETLRLATVAPLILRKATKDLEIGGYTVPAGWSIMVYPPALHLNPEKYEDPLIFNPWRWKGHGSNTTSKSYMAFGGGMRLCAGEQFAKMQLYVVLHYLSTKYRWTKVKGGETIQSPIASFPNGLHIRVTKKIEL